MAENTPLASPADLVPVDPPQPVPVAPCAPDVTVAHDYDAAAHGVDANGHPVNSVGRCAVLNGQQP